MHDNTHNRGGNKAEGNELILRPLLVSHPKHVYSSCCLGHYAEHMYDLDKMKNQKAKIPMAVSTVFCIGILVPIWATIFMQRTTAFICFIIFNNRVQFEILD
ncbi:hypothetical protein L6164_023730 [Bauhinia variegata]|uniref:Uncharacterized protein n=1 Tax=Bauhinia variegata TaxID=167791 RepID=A0ACB9MJL0_BAUVA|nr:hypothetical protein L6164_023730 [Bauhinia variegata]